MPGDYLDFDIAIERSDDGYLARVADSPAGAASEPFALPFDAPELAEFIVAVGPPRLPSRRLMPAETRLASVEDYGARLGDALLAGAVGQALSESLERAHTEAKGLRVGLRLAAVPELDSVPWEYVYSTRLARFLTLSNETPVVRRLDAAAPTWPVAVEPPLRVLAMASSPTDVPPIDGDRELELLRATTHDLAAAGLLTLDVLPDATYQSLQRALLDTHHVFHFIGHGLFDTAAATGVLVLERPDGTAHRVTGSQLGTLLHDAPGLQLVVLNSCEAARTSGRNAFSGVAQTLVQQGLPAVVAMQTEISDRAALAFSHEFYYFLSRGLPVERAICEVRKAMAIADGAAEWGTPVLLRSGTDQPFAFTTTAPVAEPTRSQRWDSLYEAADRALATGAESTARPMLEQLEAEVPGYRDVAQLLERVRPAEDSEAGEGVVEQPPADLSSRPHPAPWVPPASPVDTAASEAEARLQDRQWRLRHSLWLLAPILGCGMGTVVGFLYVALRIRQRKYWLIALGYGVVTAVALVLAGQGPQGGPINSVAGAMLLLLWGGGIVHGLIVNPEYLRWRSASAWYAGPGPRSAPTAPPAGTPVDVNTADQTTLAKLPGLNQDWAAHIVAVRATRRGFTNLDDFAAAVQLYPQQLAQLRGRVVFGPTPGQ